MTKHNTIAPKKRGRPFGSKNKPKVIKPKSTTISPSTRALLDFVRHDLEQQKNVVLPLSSVIAYLVESYINGSFK
jgi:hypothetical protein